MSERADNFRKELVELCCKYNCEILAEDHYPGYAECGEDVRMTVDFNSDYSVDPPVLGEELDLGRYFDGLGV